MRRTLFAVLIVAVVLGGGLYFYALDAWTEARSAPELVTAERGLYERIIVEQGEVESAKNVEIRCEVRLAQATSRETRSGEIRMREIGAGAIGAGGATAIQAGSGMQAAGTSTSSALGSNGLIASRLGGIGVPADGQSTPSWAAGTAGRGNGATGSRPGVTTTATIRAASGAGAAGSASGGLSTSRLNTTRDSSSRNSSRGGTNNAATAASGTSGTGTSGGGGGEAGGSATARASTTIIDIVPEGAQVEKGDWLITFDSAPLELNLSKQRIAVNTAEATMIQAKAYYDTAVIALDEYLQGTYNEQRKALENQVFVAEEFLKRSQLGYDSAGRLANRELLTDVQLDGERARVKAAQNDVDLAKQRLESLEKYTKTKMVVQHESDIRAAEVIYRNAKASYEEELKILNELQDQVAKCEVTAPEAGQVVYANVQSRRGGSEFMVEPGAEVRERQVILHLPDPTQMQVRIAVAESRVSSLRTGMRVNIHIDAFRDLVLNGTITRINSYAEPTSYWGSSVKEYVTLIRIEDPPPGVRVGLTAETQIMVESRANALTLPVRAVYELEGKTYCIARTGDRFVTREVVVKSTNGELVAIDEGQSDLEAGEQVIADARRHLDLVN